MRARIALAAAALAVAASGASAEGVDGADELRRKLQSAVSEGHVNVAVDGGTATLTGETDTISRRAAERAALASDEVDRVVNLINTM